MLSQNHIEITARDNGQILVERKIAGVTTDRFHTHDLSKPIKRTDCWIRQTQQLLSQPSAGVVIEMPVMPTIEMSQAEKLAEVENVLEFHRAIRSSQAAMITELRSEKINAGTCDAKRLKLCPSCNHEQHCCDDIECQCNMPQCLKNREEMLFEECGFPGSAQHQGKTIDEMMNLANKVAGQQ